MFDNPVPPADVPGDGRPDVTAVLGYDHERTMVWNVTARGRDDLVALQGDGDVSAIVFPAAAGFAPSEWWRGNGPVLASAAPSVGDFDLDGRQDLAVVQSCCAAGETQLWTLRSTGAAFAAPTLGWTARTGGTLP